MTVDVFWLLIFALSIFIILQRVHSRLVAINSKPIYDGEEYL